MTVYVLMDGNDVRGIYESLDSAREMAKILNDGGYYGDCYVRLMEIIPAK